MSGEGRSRPRKGLVKAWRTAQVPTFFAVLRVHRFPVSGRRAAEEESRPGSQSHLSKATSLFYQLESGADIAKTFSLWILFLSRWYICVPWRTSNFCEQQRLKRLGMLLSCSWNQRAKESLVCEEWLNKNTNSMMSESILHSKVKPARTLETRLAPNYRDLPAPAS